MSLEELREGLRNSNEDWAVKARNLLAATKEFEEKNLSNKCKYKDKKENEDGSKL